MDKTTLRMAAIMLKRAATDDSLSDKDREDAAIIAIGSAIECFPEESQMRVRDFLAYRSSRKIAKDIRGVIESGGPGRT